MMRDSDIYADCRLMLSRYDAAFDADSRASAVDIRRLRALLLLRHACRCC